MSADPALIATIVASAVIAALLATALLAWPRRAAPRRGAAFLPQDAGIGLIFDGTTLIDATPEGRALLAAPALRGPSWDRMHAALAPRFPGLEAALARLPAEGQVTLTSASADHGRRQVLRADLVGGLTRLRLATPESGPVPSFDALCALADELADLRAVMEGAPMPVWREDDGGAVVWANAAYLRLASDRLDEDEELGWPLPRMFGDSGSLGTTARHRLDGLGRQPALWFDISRQRQGATVLGFALPADAAQKAETGLRDFMQTLVLTFAHLPVGLAIFDVNRQLHLFNPAFLDLTGLPVDFLASRPRLAAVLDMLRDRSMIPEPKDARAWRKRISEMERGGAGTAHDETWSLPGGQTYRVSTRPHGEVGLAVMIEDISTEMTRTRRYRADVELGQSVIDALSEGIVVFSAAGHLVMSNEAYGTLWPQDPSQHLVEAGVLTLARQWQALSPPSPVWRQIEEFVAAPDERRAWGADVRLLDGRLMGCRVAPLAGGATLVAFRLLVPGDAARSPQSGAVARRA